MLTRRHFIRTTTALFSAAAANPLMASTWPDATQKAAWDAEVEAGGPNPWGLHQRFLPQRIVANDGLVPGDIHVDAVARYLYHIEEGGTAMRYGGHPALRKSGLTVNEWRFFYRANIEVESAYNPKARSHVGAIGLGQLMPGTAAVLGVSPHDMHQNLDGSARYLLSLLDRFGTKELALAGYNAGPEAVSRHGGIPPYRETIGHVRKVMAIFNRLSGDML